MRNDPGQGQVLKGRITKNQKGAREMKIAISSTGPDLTDLVDPRFGRCSFYVFVDMETNEFLAVANTARTH